STTRPSRECATRRNPFSAFNTIPRRRPARTTRRRCSHSFGHLSNGRVNECPAQRRFEIRGLVLESAAQKLSGPGAATGEHRLAAHFAKEQIHCKTRHRDERRPAQ